MQQGMLFHSLYAPESGVNIQQIIGTLRHPLDVSRFESAWKRVVARHEMLRAAFRWEGLKTPVQDIHAEAELPFAVQDWRTFSSEERAQRLEKFLKADRRRGISLAQAPLMRVTLFRNGDEEFQFVWTFHHAMLDGRSFASALKEVFAFYEAAESGREPSLPPSRPFRNFIEWLEQQDHSKAEPFWRAQLKGFRATTPFAVDSTSRKDSGLAVEYGEDSLRLSQEKTDALRELAKAYGVGMSGLVQGAWALLLGRYSGEEEVLFGVTRGGRRSSVKDADQIMGIFINTLPLRAPINPEMRVIDWIKDLRGRQKSLLPYEHTPLLEIQKWSDMPPGSQLFESILVFDNQTLDTELRSQGGIWDRREFQVIDQTNFPVTVYAFAERELQLKIEFDRRRFDAPVINRMLGHLQTLLEAIAKDPAQTVSNLPLLTQQERHQALVEWNETRVDYPRERCVHQLFEDQVMLTPDAPAVAFEAEQWTYRELNERADRLAAHLRAMGVGPDVLVGICAERSLEMVAGLLGILKAGGAYVPLDPAYPRERLSHMIEDSRMPVLVTQERLRANLPRHSAEVVCLDNLGPLPKQNPPADLRPSQSSDLIYVIYTSGSTGKPKGVMLTHRNVVNFFAGMDRVLDAKNTGTWLAVTSISFDISALEIFWTLTRGFKVVIQGEEDKRSAEAAPLAAPARKVDFSLFYFSGDENQNPQDKYRLLMEGAKFADKHGFAAVWTPERHFHAFGGLYPNPSVTSAAIAAVTERVQIRAGSVVLPLHNPIRVAEEWLVVDNLSHGRVGLSFASGWHSGDFVLAPENYSERRKLMFHNIQTVLKLWHGESVPFRGPDGKEVKVKALPRPVRENVPLWITSSGSPDTFQMAGELGANVLTNLLGQTVEELAAKIAIYRKAWREHGHGPNPGQVTLMLHTFVGADMKTVREKVRGPFTEYLKTSVDLVRKAASAWSFAAFQQPKRFGANQPETGFDQLSPADMEALLDHAFERYFETSGLFGTPETCLKRVNELRRVGVDEIACLIDFGVDMDSVLDSLHYLDELNRLSNDAEAQKRANYSISAQIRRHGVTHLQCTPSLARMLISDPDGAASLGHVREMLVGGEALPPALAAQLCELVGGKLHNMYGPTETAIWSTTKSVAKGGEITIGRPLANTQIYIRDKSGQPAPIGLAGELLIGGEGVARGYLHRPELTAERFIPHPFILETNARVYRTGDLARYREDGEIEFLGRLDHQVKLRGHRIELGEIETALGGHPAVKESVVVANEDQAGNARLIAFIVPGGSLPSGNGRETKDRLAQWQMIWDGAYSEGNPTPDPAFNIAGWNSSYTGQPVPEAEMREWVDRAVERILALRPVHALEIGCGTGLLLFRVAPQCRQYLGCDFSEGALKYLRQQLQLRPLPQVTLLQKSADGLENLTANPDTIILNSVAQYFPDVNYLVRVMENAVKVIAPGGRIFIGDVRNLRLLESFHASIELQQGAPELTRHQFRQRVQGRVSREEELVVSPAFFHALKEYLPRITQVDLQLKPGSFHNEVTRFRYDVTLHVDGEASADTEILWLDGGPHVLKPADILKVLAQAPSGYAGFRGVSNARLWDENVALEWMAGGKGPDTLGELREKIAAEPRVNAIDPEEVLALARAAGCAADLVWTPDADDTGAFDLIFRRAELPPAKISSRASHRKSWMDYANQPAQGRSDTKLIVQLRNHLKQRLPGIMVPSAFVLLDAMPLTPNGKVNRRALPAPNMAQAASEEDFVAPRSPVEKALAGIWREILGLESVGVDDDFFKLGGHSLLATQLVSRLREVFKIELPLRSLFESPTVAKLAHQIAARETTPGIVERTARILNQLEEMSEGELEAAIEERKKNSETRGQAVAVAS